MEKRIIMLPKVVGRVFFVLSHMNKSSMDHALVCISRYRV